MWRVKMKHLKNTTLISAFLLLFGTAFIVQCDRSSEMDRTNDNQYEQTDTLENQGTQGDQGDMRQDQQNQTDTLQNRGNREMDQNQQNQGRRDTLGTQTQSDTLDN